MAKVIKIGIITKEKLFKIEKALSRKEEIEQDIHKGFKSMNKIHKSKKTYTRKKKHRGREF